MLVAEEDNRQAVVPLGIADVVQVTEQLQPRVRKFLSLVNDHDGVTPFTDLIDGGRLDLLIDAIKAVTDALPDSGALNDLAAILADTANMQPKLGGITGSGDNTLLGYIKALLNKAANTPSDIGGTFDPAADSVEAIRDRGDAAWLTGGGGSITDILNVRPLIPLSIDVADTATWRLGLMLHNALDDLPSTAEITPGTISIDRKAKGATSWTSIVSDAAYSEAAGLVYYDEVFDSGTGYAAGDSIRITFKGQKITVAANDYEISDATGRIFYTEIREAAAPTAAQNASGLLDTVNTGSNDPTKVGGQLRRVHALACGTNIKRYANTPNVTTVRKEADDGDLVTLTTTVDGDVTSFTPS